MTEKSTDELKNILGSVHPENVAKFLEENRASMIGEELSFSSYMKGIFKEHDILQQEVFLLADIPERYGYKLLSEEKHTKQRDIILRICFAAKMTLEETQRALRIYGMSELYVRVPRDAVLTVCFNEHPDSILEVNAILKQHKFEPLRSCGIQE